MADLFIPLASWWMGRHYSNYGIGSECVHLLLLLLHVLCLLHQQEREASRAQAAAWSSDRFHRSHRHVSCWKIEREREREDSLLSQSLLCAKLQQLFCVIHFLNTILLL